MIAGDAGIETGVVVSVAVDLGAVGAVPVTVAVLSTTAGVHVGLGQRVASPCRSSTRGASVVVGQSTAPTSGSSTTIPVSVTLPVLVTTKV